MFKNLKGLVPELDHPNDRVAYLHDDDDNDGGVEDDDGDNPDDLEAHLNVLLCLLHRLPAVEGRAEGHLAAELHHLPPNALCVIHLKS